MATCGACGGNLKPTQQKHWVDNDSGERYHMRCIAGNCGICKEAVKTRNPQKELLAYFKDNPTGEVFHLNCLEQNPVIHKKFQRTVKLMPKTLRDRYKSSKNYVKRQMRQDWRDFNQGIREPVQMDIANIRRATMPQRHNPEKLAHLTPEEDKTWDKTWEFYVNEGYDDNAAGKLTWQDLQIQFPRLQEYDGAHPDVPKYPRDNIAPLAVAAAYEGGKYAYEHRGEIKRGAKKAAHKVSKKNPEMFPELSENNIKKLVEVTGIEEDFWKDISGKTIGENINCPKCGTKLDNYTKICRRCGFGINPIHENQLEAAMAGRKAVKEQYPGAKVGLINYIPGGTKMIGENPPRYSITYFDPEDEEGERDKTWYFDDLEKAKAWREELSVFWDTPEKDIKIQDIEENPATKYSKERAKKIAKSERKGGKRARVMRVAGGLYGVFVDGKRETKIRVPKVPKKLKKKKAKKKKPKPKKEKYYCRSCKVYHRTASDIGKAHRKGVPKKKKSTPKKKPAKKPAAKPTKKKSTPMEEVKPVVQEIKKAIEAPKQEIDKSELARIIAQELDKM